MSFNTNHASPIGTGRILPFGLVPGILTAALALLAVPLSVSAQIYDESKETTFEQSYVPCGYEDKLTEKIVKGKVVESTDGPDGVIDFKNQCGFEHVIELSKRFIMGWIIFGVSAATAGFAYAGLLYITAAGSQEKISHAHSIFYKTIWGFVFMLSAWLIVYTMEKIFLREDFREEFSILGEKKPKQ